MRGERVRNDLLVLRFFLPENVGKPLIDNFFSIVFDSTNFPDLSPFLVISFFGGRLLG